MILRGGELDGTRVLAQSAVAEMGRNQIGLYRAGYMGTTMPQLALPFDNIPGQHTGWGLGFLINPEAGPAGRSPGSLAWAGIYNSYYWIDPTRRVGGTIMTQLLPFADPKVLDLYSAFERDVYAMIER